MVSSSALAFVTTIHLALASLRNHRRMTPGPVSSLAAVSVLFSVTPWLFSSAIGVGLGLAAHMAWFMACEVLVPRHLPLPRKTPTSSTSNPDGAPPAGQPPRPRGFVQVPVLATFDESPDVKTIRLARPPGFEFESGQFIAVRIRIDGKDVSRCYSVSSAPDVRGYLEISVKRQGLVSNALHVTARPGVQLSVRSPNGAFKYPSGDDRPIVLLAGGIGMTPLMSMLRHAVQSEPSRRVTLLYSARTEADFAFREELAVITRRHPQVRVHLASTRSASAGIYPGRLDAELIRVCVPDIAGSVCLICGPAGMIDQMKAVLAGLDVPAAQVRYEVFEAAVAASVARDAAREDSVMLALSPRALDSGYEMRCTRSGRTIVIAPGQTLLEAAEAGGVAIESLCRAGICGTCRTRVIQGDVACASDGLSPDEQAEGLVLACVATARSGCAVDL